MLKNRLWWHEHAMSQRPMIFDIPNIYKFFFLIFIMNKKAGEDNKKIKKTDINEILVDNLVSLQKILTEVSIKFETLSSNISGLLELFETAAKNFAEKYPEGGDSDKEFLKKLDSLLEQNKTIAKGIMLMEERIRSRSPLPQQQGFKDSRFQNYPV